MALTFLSAAWRKLIMANYVVPENLLLPYLPVGTEFDLYQGRCYVSLIGFLFADVQLKGWRIPFHTNFEEVNLRFYVKHTDGAGVSHRGVVFLQELVPRFAVSFIANTLYGESYVTRATRHQWKRSAEAFKVRYEWRWNSTWRSMEVIASTQTEPIAESSVEEFITEHYWGYTRRSAKRTSGYEVAHPRWEVYPVRQFVTDIDFRAQYGEEFAMLQGQEPESVLLAEGSEVTVKSGAGVELGGR